MYSLIKKCVPCARYTLKDECPACGLKSVPSIPHRFSPEDRYGKYRRRLKAMAASERGGEGSG